MKQVHNMESKTPGSTPRAMAPSLDAGGRQILGFQIGVKGYSLALIFWFMILRYPGVMISLRADDLSASGRGTLFGERLIQLLSFPRRQKVAD